MAHRFYSSQAQGFVRCAVATPRVAVGDPAANAQSILELARRGHEQGADLIVFPELCVSAYAIDDLHLQDALLDAVEAAVAQICEASKALSPVLAIGAPVRRNGRLYNCALAISRGRILGVVPKSFLPNYREYYEKRWFAPGAGLTDLEVTLAGQTVPFGVDLVFAAEDLADFVFHLEVCEDFWAPTPPSTRGALAGALILANLSASNVVVGKAQDRAMLCASQSVRCQGAYLYAAAGPGESTTDLAWDGQGDIYELGVLLAQSARFVREGGLTLADVDVERLRLERMRTPTFNDAAIAEGHPEYDFRRVGFAHQPDFADRGLMRRLDRFPFVPDDPARLDQDCYEAFNIQVEGLAQRLKASRTEKIVIGVSGGLDSTHALIVAAKACDLLSLPRANILAFTLPGFATSDSTKSNAWALMRAIGAAAEEIDITPAARQMLSDLGHPFADGEPVYDVTFENVQAGLRTDYLFRAANQRGAIVLGTGDLSELALGWCTYGVGDQMSHYNVNGSVAKTLIQHLIRWVAAHGQFEADTNQILLSVLDTEISPELVPADAQGAIQSTQAIVGPYELQDFHLYYITRFGLRPSKVAFLAWHAWRDAASGAWPPHFPAEARNQYDLETVGRWLEVFLQRFFGFSQFKRSAMPNGPKVVSGGNLSPRGDWRAPSDGSARVWVDELKARLPDLS
ncbi:MAG: NAD(+) synthase [Phenylobacterium sp.]|uniref:NAD(+) synthase n=1 Tax=Phenylobacterium sp. TaxID=1871053 RepID=UPI002732E8C9|nr:NAD(+) synthase [Phenylobacterium sp.]MDP1642609.1 NAD(+) synthase [Phenylobacterium sp.]MDP3118740.1 NAD(+) synthase [Phenylobacterium sp.]